MFKSKVSIIIPVYNVGPYLLECLASVASQSLKEIEALCIDDASSDGSYDILRRQAKADSRFRVYRNDKNRGLSYTRNRGLGLAQGEYVYFLDADDLITPDAMERLYGKAKTLNLDVVMFEAGLLFESGELKRRFHNYPCEYRNRGQDEKVITGMDLFAEVIEDGTWSPSVPRQFWKKEYLDAKKLSFFDGILHEDNLFSFEAVLQAERAMILREKLFVRRFRDSSIMTSKYTCKNVTGLFVVYCESVRFSYQLNCGTRCREAAARFLDMLLGSVIRSYRGLKSKTEMESCMFHNVMYQHLFRELISGKDGGRLVKEITDEKADIVKRFPKVWIYGAGITGREVLERLDGFGIQISGFAVSDKGKNPAFVMGHAVRQINEIKSGSGETIFLLALARGYQEDVANRLRRMGYDNIVEML